MTERNMQKLEIKDVDFRSLMFTINDAMEKVDRAIMLGLIGFQPGVSFQLLDATTDQMYGLRTKLIRWKATHSVEASILRSDKDGAELLTATEDFLDAAQRLLNDVRAKIEAHKASMN